MDEYLTRIITSWFFGHWLWQYCVNSEMLHRFLQHDPLLLRGTCLPSSSNATASFLVLNDTARDDAGCSANRQIMFNMETRCGSQAWNTRSKRQSSTRYIFFPIRITCRSLNNWPSYSTKHCPSWKRCWYVSVAPMSWWTDPSICSSVPRVSLRTAFDHGSWCSVSFGGIERQPAMNTKKQRSMVLFNMIVGRWMSRVGCGWFAKAGILRENVGFDIFYMDVFNCIYTSQSSMRNKRWCRWSLSFLIFLRQSATSQRFSFLFLLNLWCNSRQNADVVPFPTRI